MNKTIHLTIICLLCFFSSIFVSHAQEGYMSQLLQLETGTEIYKFQNLPTLNPRTFKNPNVQFTFNRFRHVDAVLRNEIISQYAQWNITTYQLQDLIRTYWLFIYHTWKTFGYIDRSERWLRGKEIETAIANGYSQMRMSYRKVQGILSN